MKIMTFAKWAGLFLALFLVYPAFASIQERMGDSTDNPPAP